jgi:hypothetical protein
MKHTYALPEIERELAQLDDVNKLNAILKRVLTSTGVFRNPDIFAHRIFMPGLDAQVPKIADMLRLDDVDLPKSNDNAVFIVTRLYRTGGHSQIVMDIARRLAPGSFTLILTDVYGETRYGLMLKRERGQSVMGERSVMSLQSLTFPERMIELYQILKAIRPSRIFLMGHNMDIVSVVGCWPFRSIVDFIHHADQTPSVGATLPFGAHVDPTYTCHLACREAKLNPIYSGMTAPRPADRAARPNGKPVLRVATCGSPHKYEGVRGHAWTDYALAVLKRPNTEIIHIGPAPPEFQAGIVSALKAGGVDPARYVFTGWAPSLGQALVEREVDAYLGSFPETGGKANLEAMAAGVPTLVPTGADVAPLGRFGFPLPLFRRVDGPDELEAALDEVPALTERMRAPAAAAALAGELERFEAYVAGAPLPPTG